MRECWDSNPDARPSFHLVHQRLCDILQVSSPTYWCWNIIGNIPKWYTRRQGLLGDISGGFRFKCPRWKGHTNFFTSPSHGSGSGCKNFLTNKYCKYPQPVIIHTIQTAFIPGWGAFLACHPQNFAGSAMMIILGVHIRRKEVQVNKHQ